jgi:hypothetical protein
MTTMTATTDCGALYLANLESVAGCKLVPHRLPDGGYAVDLFDRHPTRVGSTAVAGPEGAALLDRLIDAVRDGRDAENRLMDAEGETRTHLRIVP